jgi:hypothetical protein
VFNKGYSVTVLSKLTYLAYRKYFVIASCLKVGTNMKGLIKFTVCIKVFVLHVANCVIVYLFNYFVCWLAEE